MVGRCRFDDRTVCSLGLLTWIVFFLQHGWNHQLQINKFISLGVWHKGSHRKWYKINNLNLMFFWLTAIVPENMTGSVTPMKIKHLSSLLLCKCKALLHCRSTPKEIDLLAGPLSFLMRYEHIRVDSHVKLLMVLDWKIK